jgi:hypothetical protein
MTELIVVFIGRKKVELLAEENGHERRGRERGEGENTAPENTARKSRPFKNLSLAGRTRLTKEERKGIAGGHARRSCPACGGFAPV